MGSKAEAIFGGGLHISRFCLVVEFHRGGSVTNKTTRPSFKVYILFGVYYIYMKSPYNL